MIIKKAYKFRLYPSKEQQTLIRQTFGCSRFLYNHTLYDVLVNGASFNKIRAITTIPLLKKEHPWLKEVDSIALQASIEQLADGFDRFFKKQTNYPRFKSKKNTVKSYTTKMVNQNIQLNKNKIKLPKLGWMPFAKSKEVQGTIKRATIRQSASGKFFISILVEQEQTYVRQYTHQSVGIDLGLKDYVVLSDEESKIKNPRHLKQLEKKLTKAQRILSRRTVDSSNWHKQKVKVARIHEKIAYTRRDFLHKLSRQLVEDYDVIGIEDLGVTRMLKNKQLAQSISDASWGTFISLLKYKADWYGATLIQVDQHFASSQICSACGYKNRQVKALSVREWDCPSCHAKHDRDKNAAFNIKVEAERLFGLQSPTAGTAGIA